MKPNARGPAETPAIVRTATWINAGLLLVALIGPRMMPDGGLDAAAGAAMMFVIPMTLILVIGTGAAIYSYAVARRQNLGMRWTAFLPLAVFLAGVAGTLFLVYSQTI